ncbi:MAG TPA: YtxH domain-containing protein [Candidatus Eisenbacteria bacterium]|nr:YtxH domain-containing protein [Candidatus Eisenbacteria bacterium]
MNTSNMSGSLLPFALGVGVGAAVALLLAPRTGQELREDISGKVTDGVNELRAAGKHVKRKARGFVTDAKERVDEAVLAGEAAFDKANKE